MSALTLAHFARRRMTKFLNPRHSKEAKRSLLISQCTYFSNIFLTVHQLMGRQIPRRATTRTASNQQVGQYGSQQCSEHQILKWRTAMALLCPEMKRRRTEIDRNRRNWNWKSLEIGEIEIEIDWSFCRNWTSTCALHLRSAPPGAPRTLGRCICRTVDTFDHETRGSWIVLYEEL